MHYVQKELGEIKQYSYQVYLAVHLTACERIAAWVYSSFHAMKTMHGTLDAKCMHSRQCAMQAEYACMSGSDTAPFSILHTQCAHNTSTINTCAIAVLHEGAAQAQSQLEHYSKR